MRQNDFLNSLVQDCITFNLDTKESLQYIKARYGKPISRASFNRGKASILSDHSTDIWLHNFTRIGYVKNHQQDIEVIRKLRDDSMRQLQTEIDKQNRDEDKILKLKDNIIETTKLLSELNLGTPIISAIKAKVEGNNRNETILSVT
jgi:hypothetical protein